MLWIRCEHEGRPYKIEGSFSGRGQRTFTVIRHLDGRPLFDENLDDGAGLELLGEALWTQHAAVLTISDPLPRIGTDDDGEPLYDATADVIRWSYTPNQPRGGWLRRFRR